MSLKHLFPFHLVEAGKLRDLEARLADFYTNPPESYYEIADQAADHYHPHEQPFHCHLASQTHKGMVVFELGCGTAHLCPHIEARGGVYHGMDYSEELLHRNRLFFPRATFWNIDQPPSRKFDLVASLYTIEHVTNPPAYLEQLWKYCLPGGLIGIVCPDFIDGAGLPNSVYYGTSLGRVRSKLARGRIGDALLHVLEAKVLGPLWKIRARSAPPGAFWLNLDPRDLVGQEHTIDGDAVHFPRLTDLTNWLEKRGAEVLATSLCIPGVTQNVLKHNCYVLARKPA